MLSKFQIITRDICIIERKINRPQNAKCVKYMYACMQIVSNDWEVS